MSISLKIPAISPPVILMMMVFLIVELLECVRLIEDMDLGLKRLATLPIAIMENFSMVIEVVIMEELDIGLNIPATFPLEIV